MSQRARYTFTAPPEGYVQKTRIPQPSTHSSLNLTSHKQYMSNWNNFRNTRSQLLATQDTRAESLAHRMAKAHLAFPSSNQGHANMPSRRNNSPFKSQSSSSPSRFSPSVSQASFTPSQTAFFEQSDQHRLKSCIYFSQLCQPFFPLGI